MNNTEQAVLIGKFNETLHELGLNDKYRLSWNDELQNEAVVAGTVADIDARDEFIFALRLRVDSGAPFDIYAENCARRWLKLNVQIGDFLKVRARLKPAAFDTGFCYLFVDGESDILEIIHEAP